MNLSDQPKKHTLFVLRRSPYGNGLARASLDAALATAVFEQPVSLLFAGNGVLHLLPGQDSAAVGVKNIGKLLGSLPLYDIEQVYVDEAAARRYNIELADSPVAAVALDAAGIRELMDTCDHLLGF